MDRLALQLQQAGIAYEQMENAFGRIAGFAQANHMTATWEM